MQTDTILPIIVPRDYFQFGNWPGRYKLLKHPALAVTWVDASKPDSMLYINVDAHAELEAAGYAVHELAMRNLRAASALTTHESLAEGWVVFRAMMHSDGLGSSRLLLLPELDQMFPMGYLAAIPERSCGIVVPTAQSSADRASVLALIASCYENGTTQMLPGLSEAGQFALADA